MRFGYFARHSGLNTPARLAICPFWGRYASPSIWVAVGPSQSHSRVGGGFPHPEKKQEVCQNAWVRKDSELKVDDGVDLTLFFVQGIEEGEIRVVAMVLHEMEARFDEGFLEGGEGAEGSHHAEGGGIAVDFVDFEETGEGGDEASVEWGLDLEPLPEGWSCIGVDFVEAFGGGGDEFEGRVWGELEGVEIVDGELA